MCGSMLRHPRLLALAALAGWAALGCGSPDREYYDPNAEAGASSGGSAGSSGGGGASTGGAANTGGATSTGGVTSTGGGTATGGTGPDGGTGGAGPTDAGQDQYTPPVVPGRPGMDLVAAGALISSTNYKLVLSVGEGPGGNGVMTSPSYTLKAGLIGTTQP